MRRGIALFVEGIGRTTGAAGTPKGLAGAPRRIARAWTTDLLAGYRQDPAAILAAMRTRAPRDLVAVRDIAFSSVCMHHLLPFHGRAHLAYAPDGRITGLSRLGRLVDCLSRRLQIQESLTRQIVDALQNHLAPRGAACVLEATHTCVTTRGARKSGSRIVTTAFTGTWARSPAARREVLALLGVGRRVGRGRGSAR